MVRRLEELAADSAYPRSRLGQREHTMRILGRRISSCRLASDSAHLGASIAGDVY
jgi:hypothetical protein